MDVVREENGRWAIVHAGKTLKPSFDSEDDAWEWADSNVDDQVFDGPNTFLQTPLEYRAATPNESHPTDDR